MGVSMTQQQCKCHGRALIIKIYARHLSEHLIVLVCNADQLLNEAIRKVPTQHIRYQQRLLERASACGKQTTPCWIK